MGKKFILILVLIGLVSLGREAYGWGRRPPHEIDRDVSTTSITQNEEPPREELSITATATSLRVRNGDKAMIRAKVKDHKGVSEVFSRMGDIEFMKMDLISGTIYDGEWFGEWVAHGLEGVSDININVTAKREDGSGKTFVITKKDPWYLRGTGGETLIKEILGKLLLVVSLIFLGFEFSRRKIVIKSNRLKKRVFVGGLILSIAYLTYSIATRIRYNQPVLYCDCAGYSFFPALHSLFLCTVPYFLLGCWLAGLIIKWFRTTKPVVFSNMFSSCIMGSILPTCSCSTAPITKGLLETAKVKVRSILAFTLITPILNPMVIIMAWGMLGAKYTLVRICAVFILAFIAGILGERLFKKPARNPDNPTSSTNDKHRKGSTPCNGCGYGEESLLTGYRIARGLAMPILIGIIIGGFVAAVYSVDELRVVIVSGGGGLKGLLFMATVGLPLFICAGQDLIILAPLLEGGLPLGHALAFSITGNAICITGIAALLGVFKKRVVTFLIGIIWVGAILIGLLINSSLLAASIVAFGIFLLVLFREIRFKY